MTKKDRIQRPQCIWCNRVFTNANLKTSNLNEHYNNRNGSVQSRNDFSILKIKRAWFDSGGTLLKQAFVPMEKQLLLACCKVTFLCGKKRALYSCWRTCDTMWTTLVTVTTCLQTRGTRKFYESSGGNAPYCIKPCGCNSRPPGYAIAICHVFMISFRQKRGKHRTSKSRLSQGKQTDVCGTGTTAFCIPVSVRCFSMSNSINVIDLGSPANRIPSVFVEKRFQTDEVTKQ